MATPGSSAHRSVVDALPASARDRPLTIEDRALFIYTSEPPAAQGRQHEPHRDAGHPRKTWQPSRRTFDCREPTPPAAGGDRAILVSGGSVVIREISAREFWDDIALEHDLQYIAGSALPAQLAAALGDPPAGWPAATACGPMSARLRRFPHPHIIEFYAATEAMCRCSTSDGGASGASWFLMALSARYSLDIDRQQPIRDPRGFCVECRTEEQEVIGKILKMPSKPGARLRAMRPR